jgi:hypothetical protein
LNEIQNSKNPSKDYIGRLHIDLKNRKLGDLKVKDSDNAFELAEKFIVENNIDAVSYD